MADFQYFRQKPPENKNPRNCGDFIIEDDMTYPSLFSSNLALISAKAPKSPKVDFSTLA